MSNPYCRLQASHGPLVSPPQSSRAVDRWDAGNNDGETEVQRTRGNLRAALTRKKLCGESDFTDVNDDRAGLLLRWLKRAYMWAITVMEIDTSER